MATGTRLTSHETEAAFVFRVGSAVSDGIDWIMTSEEQLSLAVGEGDALTGDFEVDDGGGGGGFTIQGHIHGFLHRLRSRQRFHVNRVQIQHVTGGAL